MVDWCRIFRQLFQSLRSPLGNIALPRSSLNSSNHESSQSPALPSCIRFRSSWHALNASHSSRQSVTFPRFVFIHWSMVSYSRSQFNFAMAVSRSIEASPGSQVEQTGGDDMILAWYCFCIGILFSHGLLVDEVSLCQQTTAVFQPSHTYTCCEWSVVIQ